MPSVGAKRAEKTMNWQWLKEKAVEGLDVDWKQYGEVKAVYQGNLLLLNYTSKAIYSDHWNWLERISRGLILDRRTGEVVARPFDRFFNWLEGGRCSAGHIVTVTEKVDGSLGILYRHDDGYKIATRGSFDSEQARWATEHLHEPRYSLSGLPEEYTLLFEIVYPDNRVIVDYGDTEALFLLGARNRFNGEYLPFYPDVYELAYCIGFPIPRVFAFNSVEDIIAATDTLSASQEGWVVEFSDGQRFKFKGDRYRELHRLVWGMSFKAVLRAVADGTYEDLVVGVPMEFTIIISEWKRQIDEKARKLCRRVESAYAAAPKGTRKEFALWAKEHHPDLMPYLFLVLDGRPIEPLVYKREF